MIKIVDWNNSSMDAWKQQRDEIEGIDKPYTRIGASDVSCILGLSKYKSRRRLVLHLIGAYSKFTVTPITIFGHKLEPVIAEYWESYDHNEETFYHQHLNNIKVRKLKKAEFFLLNSKYPNSFVSLDYINDGEQYSPFDGELYEELSPNEMKTVDGIYYSTHEDWKSGITPAYYAQVQYQLALTETSKAVFHVLGTDRKYRVMEVFRDDNYIKDMMKAINEFVEEVNICKLWYLKAQLETDELLKHEYQNMFESLLPEAQGLDDSVDLANELHKPPIDEDILSFNVEEWSEEDSLMESYMQVLDEEKVLAERKNAVKAKLIDKCDGFEKIISPNFTAIIRGLNSKKSKYFSVKRNKN